MMKYFNKYKELILYVFFGGCTTIVNIVVYYSCTRFINLDMLPSTVIAWSLSVIFAYITNRRFVFESKEKALKALLTEFMLFISCRLLSGLMDVGIMYVFVDVLGIDDMLIKIISNVLVIVLNYVASKLMIFK